MIFPTVQRRGDAQIVWNSIARLLPNAVGVRFPNPLSLNESRAE